MADPPPMSPRRALVAGAVLGGALAAAVLVYAVRPDAGAAVDAARLAEAEAITPPHLRPVEAETERGAPAYATRFDPEDHGGHRQSWAVAQAPSGLVYVANSDGVLEYDGTGWRLIDVPGFRARAVAVGPDGAVYVGGEGTAGVLAPDSTGHMAYREIAGDAELEGASVWEAVPTESGVLFQSFDRLLAVEAGRVVDIERVPDGRRFHKAFAAGGAVYVRLEGTGLLRYEDHRLVPVGGGGRLAEVSVRALLDLDGAPGGALLVVTDDELFRLDPSAADPLVTVPTAATATLRQTRAYHGCPVGPAESPALAITTMGGGVLIVSPGGEVIERLGQAAGLTPDDLVLGCDTDAQGGLWLALSEGVARVDAAAPLTAFDARLGLDGAVYGAIRYDGQLYTATSRGVYRLRPSSGGLPSAFEPVLFAGGDVGQAWSLLATEGGLLVAGTDGVFAIEGLEARPVLSETAFTLASLSQGADAAVYAGVRSGLAVLRYTGGIWTEVVRSVGTDNDVRSVLAVEGGAWAVEGSGRLLRIGSDGQVVRAYDRGDGVPEGLAAVQDIDGALAVLAADGPYRVGGDGEDLRFSPMSALTRVIQETVGDLADGYGIRTDDEGRVWVSGRDQARAVVRRDGRWTDATPPVLRQVGGVYDVLSEPGVLWASTTSGLLRLAGPGAGRYAAVVPARVSAVEAGGGVAVEDQGATVPYGSPVRFRFSAAAFNDADATRYRTQLVGHDDAPSAWSDETLRDYTNLPPGDYAFRVEALTAQGTAARPSTLAVHVPAPWYLTTWAAVVAALLVGSLVVAVAFTASHEQRRRADAEQRRADELARLNDELRHADEVKDSMLANTSHELRTPLTAILGFSEILADHPDEDVSMLAGHMLSGGRRLLHTVNDLLDIARLRSGKVVLAPTATDAGVLARRVVDELSPLAAEKGLALAVVPEGLAVPAVLDPDAFARIVTNLVSNGVKFTDEGSVTVTVDGGGGEVRLAVRDTGRGIDAEFVPRLFSTFEQESTGYARTKEGSGLGLAITSRLVSLMGGRITVESEVGRGSTFHVTIPAGPGLARPSVVRGGPRGADPDWPTWPGPERRPEAEPAP